MNKDEAVKTLEEMLKKIDVGKITELLDLDEEHFHDINKRLAAKVVNYLGGE